MSIVAREGQHSGVFTYPFSNTIQWSSGSTARRCRYGITSYGFGIESSDWSSVTITITFGRGSS